MRDIKSYKEKYAKRQDCAGRRKYPAGGEDVSDLCMAINNLLILVRKLQCQLPVYKQNEVETDLMIIFK